jgi:CBS domain-containing protein
MKVKDVMNSDVIYCKSSDSIRSTAQILKKNGISGAPVVDNENNIVGVISEEDLLRFLEIPDHRGLWLPSPFEVIEIPIREFVSWEETKHMLSDFGDKKVQQVMKTDVLTITPEDTIEYASQIMTKHKINRLPVIEDGKLIGIVTRGDIIEGLSRS